MQTLRQFLEETEADAFGGSATMVLHLPDIRAWLAEIKELEAGPGDAALDAAYEDGVADGKAEARDEAAKTLAAST